MAFPQQQLEKFKYTEFTKAPDDNKSDSFEARLLKTANEYYELTKTSRARRYTLWLYADLFAKGIHYFLYNPVHSTVKEMSQETMDECMYTPTPLLQQAVETIAAQYGASNGKITSMPIDSSDPKIKAVVRGLREYADYIDWKFWQSNPSERQTECKLIPLRGVYNFIEFDKSKGQKIQLPQYEEVSKKVCGDCGEEIEDGQEAKESAGTELQPPPMGGNAGDEVYNGVYASDSVQRCPACSSTNIQSIAAGLNNKGNVDRRTGECVRHVIDPYQVEINDRVRSIEESPYLICDDVLFKTKAKQLYPHLKDVKGSANLGSYESGYVGLHFLNQLQCLIGNSGALSQNKPDYLEGGSAQTVSNYGSFLSPLLCWRRRVWLDREVYADWKMGDLKSVVLPGRNEPIPPETKVIDVFPAGLCFHIINGDCIVLTENQDKNAVWSFVGYRMPSAGLHGTGVNSMISLVRGYDSANSFGLQALLMAALGILVVDERIPNARNVPGSHIRLPQNARLQGETIQSMVGRLDMGAGNAISAAEPIKEGFRGNIASASMAPNADGGDLRPQGLGKGTATAVRYQAGATGTLVNPPLELYAAHRAKVVEQTVQLERTSSIRPSQFGKFGDTVVRWFDATLIPEDVRFGASPDSWRMRTLETQREDVGSAIQLGVETIQNEALRNKAYQVFGLDDDIDESSDWEVLGEKRLDALKALAPQFEAMSQQANAEAQAMTAQAEQLIAVNTPESILAGQQLQQQAQQALAQIPLQLIDAAKAKPLPMDAKGHPHLIKFYENVRLSDEFDSFPPILQEAIQRLWAIHTQGVGEAGAILAEQQLTAQEPLRQAQQQDAMQAQQMEQEGQGDDSEAQMMQAEQEAQGQQHQSMESEAARQHDKTEAAKTRKHEKEMANKEDKRSEKDRKHQLELAKLKPKPKGKD